MRRLNSRLAAAAMLAALSASAANAQPPSSEEGLSIAGAPSRNESAVPQRGSLKLARTTIDSGGAELVGAGLVLTATVGQPEIGIVTDGGLRLTAGFHRLILSAGPIEDRIFSDRFSGDP